MLRMWVEDYIQRHGRGSRGRIADAAGVSRPWLSDLMSDDETVRPRSISWARFRAIVQFLGNVPLSTIIETWIPKEELESAQRRHRDERPPPEGSRVLEPLEIEVLKAVTGMPREVIQQVIWHARAARRALVKQPGMGKCLRCGEQADEAQLKITAGVCRACWSWLDIPEMSDFDVVAAVRAFADKRRENAIGVK